MEGTEVPCIARCCVHRGERLPRFMSTTSSAALLLRTSARICSKEILKLDYHLQQSPGNLTSFMRDIGPPTDRNESPAQLSYHEHQARSTVLPGTRSKVHQHESPQPGEALLRYLISSFHFMFHLTLHCWRYKSPYTTT